MVHAVLTKLEACQDYHLSDHGLLRRIAFVQTGDNGTHDGGIWAVNEAKVNLVSDMMRDWLNNSCRGLLNHNQTLIDNTLRNLTASTNIPIVSGLAASFYLQHLITVRGLVIPLAGDIDGQARFWYKYYYTSDGPMNVAVFTREVNRMEEQTTSVGPVKRSERMESKFVSLNLFFVFILHICHQRGYKQGKGKQFNKPRATLFFKEKRVACCLLLTAQPSFCMMCCRCNITTTN